MIVVADTSPINYLLQISCLESTLPKLYESVVLPHEALIELLDAGAPATVRTWASALPKWVTVHRPSGPSPLALNNLGAGERSAITIALERNVPTVLLDDQEARLIAESIFKLRVLGTLGILRDAQLASLLDATAAYRKLRSQTNFYCSSAVEERFLALLRP